MTIAAFDPGGAVCEIMYGIHSYWKHSPGLWRNSDSIQSSCPWTKSVTETWGIES